MDSYNGIRHAEQTGQSNNSNAEQTGQSSSSSSNPTVHDWDFLPVFEPPVDHGCREIHHTGCCRGELLLSSDELARIIRVLPAWFHNGAEQSRSSHEAVSLAPYCEISFSSSGTTAPASKTNAPGAAPRRRYLKLGHRGGAKPQDNQGVSSPRSNQGLSSPRRPLLTPRAEEAVSPKAIPLTHESCIRNSKCASSPVQKRRLNSKNAPYRRMVQGPRRSQSSGPVQATAIQAEGLSNQLDVLSETTELNQVDVQLETTKTDEDSGQETVHIEPQPTPEEKMSQWVPLSLDIATTSAQASEDLKVAEAEALDESVQSRPSDPKKTAKAGSALWQHRAMGCLLNRRPEQSRTNAPQLLKRKGGASKASSETGDASGRGKDPRLDLDAVLNAWL